MYLPLFKKLILLFFIIITIFISINYKQIHKHNFKYKYGDVLIQAGHEGRITGSTGASSKYGKEIEWTAIVADETTRLLKEAGVDVIRCGAKIPISRVKLAVSIHFDGSKKPCNSGASIGYGNSNHKKLADNWKDIYSKEFPFRWMKDNFTKNLSQYYGYKYTFTQKGFLVLELGELTCDKQALWLKPRLKELGRLIAYFILKELKTISLSISKNLI